MFRPRIRLRKHKSSSSRSSPSSQPYKPLLQILEYGQSPEDVREQPRNLVLQGQTDVYISRAEIDLKKAIQNLAFITHGQINSFPTLAALSLPSSAAALFWAIHAFLQHQYQKSNLENPIHRRNHDARLLFQQLARLDIDQWYDHSVDITAPSALSASIKFPFGPPAPGQLYRQHPLQEKYDCYYPVTNYFSQLFEEREIALLELLKDLGATKVTISDHSTSASDEGFSTQKVLKYPGRGGLSSQSIDTQQHPWLPYEPTWQTVVNDRFQKGILSTRFEFNLDVMGLLEAQIQTILQIMPGFDSMELPANCEEVLSTEMLQTKTVQVEFSKIQHKQSKTLEH